jgi:hypothetical protein
MGHIEDLRIDDNVNNFRRGNNFGVELDLYDSNRNIYDTDKTIFERDNLKELNSEFNKHGIYIDIPIIGGMGGGETGQIVVKTLELLIVNIGPFLGGLFVNFSYDMLKSCFSKVLKKARPQPKDHLVHIEHAEKVIIFLYNPDRESNDEELDRSLRALLGDVKLEEDQTKMNMRVNEQLSKYDKG